MTERGELDSLNSIDVLRSRRREDEAVTIVPEGTRVTKAWKSPSTTWKGFKNRSRSRKSSGSRLTARPAAKAELEVQENKQKSEIAKADSAAQLAELDLEKYEKAEYTAEFNEKKAPRSGGEGLEEAKSDSKFTDRLISRGLGADGSAAAQGNGGEAAEYLVEPR